MLLILPLGADLAAAWFGLIGVVVGGIITGVVSVWLQRDQERREYILALRLADAEVRDIVRIVQDATTNHHWPPGLKTKSWAQSWSTNRRALAARMDSGAFKIVADAYSLTEQLQNGLANEDKPVPKGDRDETFLLEVQSAFREAADALRPLAGHPRQR